MSVATKVKAMMQLKEKKNIELAEYLGISKQALSNKYALNTFSVSDLTKIAEFLNCQLAFIMDNEHKFIIEQSDAKERLKRTSK